MDELSDDDYELGASARETHAQCYQSDIAQEAIKKHRAKSAVNKINDNILGGFMVCFKIPCANHCSIFRFFSWISSMQSTHIGVLFAHLLIVLLLLGW